MISLVIAALALRSATDDVAFHSVNINKPGSTDPYLLIQDNVEQSDPPWHSPKKFGVPARPWDFEWISRTLPYVAPNKQYELRFRVFAQSKKNDLPARTSRMLGVLWGEMYNRAKIDHRMEFNGRIVDVYLCFGGQAGGEQLFDLAMVKREDGSVQPVNVNTIYIYDVNSFTDPMEMAREVAHEYGHAVLLGIGGYSAPEGWANGFLGEKIFLSWVKEGMAEGRLLPEDAMGVTQNQLDGWLKTHADPLAVAAASAIPTPLALKDPSAKGMDKYLGLAVLANDVFPNSVFWHSMLFTGSTEAKDYPDALVRAAAEPDEYELKIPKFLADKPIWLPLGKGRVANAKILKIQGSWTQLQAPEGKLTVKNR